MKRVSVALLAASALAVTSAAITAQETSKPKAATKDTIMVTGCLQAGTAPDSFTLTNVSQTAQTSTATGTAGSATASASATSEGGKADAKYELSADAGVNLKPHVGHKVAITGTPEKAAMGASGSATTKTDVKKLRVTAVKHVSPSCP